MAVLLLPCRAVLFSHGSWSSLGKCEERRMIDFTKKIASTLDVPDAARSWTSVCPLSPSGSCFHAALPLLTVPGSGEFSAGSRRSHINSQVHGPDGNRSACHRGESHRVTSAPPVLLTSDQEETPGMETGEEVSGSAACPADY